MIDSDGLYSATIHVVQEIFGGDTPIEPLHLYQIAARAIVVYAAGILVVRLGKGRLIGRVTPVDVIVGFILGSLLSRGMTGHASISGTVVASASIVAFHWLLTFLACRWHRFGCVVKGHEILIVNDGARVAANMMHSHISEHDLQEGLRMHGIEDVQRVHRAYKERNGEISVIQRDRPPRIVEVAVNGGVQTVRVEIQ